MLLKPHTYKPIITIIFFLAPGAENNQQLLLIPASQLRKHTVESQSKAMNK